MKKTAFMFAALAATLSLSFAAPLYFTFTGNVTLVPQDQGGYAAAHGLHAGTVITYVFAVDTTQNGYTTTNGAPTDKEDVNNMGYQANYFYDSLISASAFSPALPGHDNESFFGYRTITTLGAASRYAKNFQVILGTYKTYTQVSILIPDSAQADVLPKVGDKVTATESYVDSSAASSSIALSMTLTAVSATKPSIGIRAPAPAAQAWMNAQRKDGSLRLRNHSGKPAQAKLMDVTGKTVFAAAVGDEAIVPASALPHGTLFLEMTAPGQSGSALQIPGL